jgi:glycosyltransferase involved in cell wall biosynthesis
VLDQTFRDFEFLIYNDGSNRKVTEYIRSLANWDNRIRIIESETNHGLGYALNRCIEVARGRYLARMDADDVSHENRFQVEVEFLEQHPEYMWCGTNCEIFDSKGVWGEGTRPETPQADDYLKYSPFIHPTVMYRAELFDRVAGYAEDRITLRCEDYELFMRLFTMGYKGYNIQQALLGYFVNRKKYHNRPLRYSLYESRVRHEGFVRMGLMWPKGWLYVFRPIVGGLLPAGLVERYKERIAEL